VDSVITWQGDRTGVPPPPSAYNDRDTCKQSIELIHSKQTRPMPEIATLTSYHSLDSEADSKSRALDQFRFRFMIVSLSARPLPFSSTPSSYRPSSVRVIPHTAAAAPVYDEQQHWTLPLAHPPGPCTPRPQTPNGHRLNVITAIGIRSSLALTLMTSVVSTFDYSKVRPGDPAYKMKLAETPIYLM